MCGGTDDDCDGLVDDEHDSVDVTGGVVSYADSDGDGFGDIASAVTTCAIPAGGTEDATDCDDADVTVNPEAAEVCADALDNDCDLDVDEDCAASCADLAVVQYYDSFGPGATPLDEAQGLLGFTGSFAGAESDFTAAYDGGTWDVVVIDVPGSSLPAGVADRIEAAIAGGSVVLLSYWYLGYDADLPGILGVTVDSSFSSPLALSAASGSTLWDLSETLPASIANSTADAGVNGVVLSPVDAATSETLAIFSGDASLDAIVATYDGQVIVNGHLPWDFQSTDDDGDGVGDMAELYVNELLWSTGCAR